MEQTIIHELEHKNTIVGFYQALCHRANTSLFFWDDGLPLSSCDDLVTASTAAMLAPKTVLNGDGPAVTGGMDGLLVLNSNPLSFQFDSTRCSDSIVILSTTLQKSLSLKLVKITRSF